MRVFVFKEMFLFTSLTQGNGANEWRMAGKEGDAHQSSKQRQASGRRRSS